MTNKVQSDGLDLGAQRRSVLTNDLPVALEVLTGYRKFIISGGIPDKTGWPGIAEVDTNPLCQFVSKDSKNFIFDMLEGKTKSFEYPKNIKNVWTDNIANSDIIMMVVGGYYGSG